MSLTPYEILSLKGKRKIIAITAYDYSFASLIDEAGVDIILVGDSVGMVMLGHQTTLEVDLAAMIHHTRAVARGVSKAVIVADMPFLSYKVDVKDAVYNAGRLIKEGGAHAVKIEGGAEVTETIRAMVAADIAVMGHVGLRPQAIYQLGGYKVQATTPTQQTQILSDIRRIFESGAFAIVLECIPYEFAKQITESCPIPTIGIGAGPYCDGQIIVLHDMLGFYERCPKFVRKYADLRSEVISAIKRYAEDVRKGVFPSLSESYGSSD